jgi:DNA-binding NarL/FixJ family response regulator
MNKSKTLNLLIVDDHEMFREGLTRTLEREPDFKVVAQCGSSAEALNLLGRNVNVVLLDVDLGNERALVFVEEARKLCFEGKILVVTAGIGGQEAVRLMEAGVAGILHKHHSGQTLCESIRKLWAGGSCLEEKYVTSLIRSVDHTRPPAISKLTDRDRALLRHILEGLTNREIGERMKISEGAVKASLRLLFERLNVRTRTQLVKVALQEYQDQL